MKMRRAWMIGWLTLLSLLPSGPASADAEKTFSEEHLDQLVAPIALYPDSLVAQILMAATYPLEIVQASRWREQNSKLEGKELEKALGSQGWDPSVKSLTNFPDVLKRMNDNLDWTQDLGDAVLGQETGVTAAIQRMRKHAKDAGNLKTGTEQTVVVEQEIIRIEPATEVVYVPAYSPTVIYGSAWAPASYYYPIYGYPPSYWYPPGYTAAGVIFGMAVGAAIWNNWNYGHVDWHGGSVDIDRNFNFERNINTGDINIGNKVGGGDFGKWEHNVDHRGGVRYRDSATNERFAGQRADTREARLDRDAARGFDREGERGGERAGERRADAGSVAARESDGRRGDGQRPAAGDRGGDRTAERAGTRDLDRGAGARDPDRVGASAGTRDLSGGSRQSRDISGSTRSAGAFDVGGSNMARSSSSRGASSRGSSSFAGAGRAGGGGGGGRGGGGRGR